MSFLVTQKVMTPETWKDIEEVKFDKWGNEVKTSSDSCISAINSYYDQVLCYGRERTVILEAPRHDPQCVLANILAAHFLCSSAPSKAPAFLDAAKSRLDYASKYEKEVYKVIKYLISADRDDDVAVELHSKLLKSFPRDLVSLKRAQVLCFYMGRPDLSLQLVQQVLPANEQENYIYGLLAFSLLELGKNADAEQAAKRGYEINKDDPWAQHALCHVLQFECRFQEAVNFMEQCSTSWHSLSSFMCTHNWWHVALCYMEGHSSMKKVIEIYDHYIWNELERSDAAPVEVYLNAVGLLLRVYVRGEINAFGDRLKILASCLKDQAYWHVEWLLDLLSLWALACVGEHNEAENLLKSFKSRISLMRKRKQQHMQKAVLLAEALYEYGKGDYKRALEFIGGEFEVNEFKIIGASDEQLDVFSEVRYSILLNAGQATKGVEEIEKQLKKREATPFLWRLLEKGYSMLGRQEATMAGEKARDLENEYSKQLS